MAGLKSEYEEKIKNLKQMLEEQRQKQVATMKSVLERDRENEVQHLMDNHDDDMEKLRNGKYSTRTFYTMSHMYVIYF